MHNFIKVSNTMLKFRKKQQSIPKKASTDGWTDKQNIDLIKKAIDIIDWKKAFESCDPNKQVNILTDTVFDVLNNFILNRTTLIDNRVHLGLTRKSEV